MSQFQQMTKQPANINFNNQIESVLPMVNMNRNAFHESPAIHHKNTFMVKSNVIYQQTPLLNRKSKPESMQLPLQNMKGPSKFKEMGEQIIESPEFISLQSKA